MSHCYIPVRHWSVGVGVNHVQDQTLPQTPFLVDSHQEQAKNGLIADQVKFTMSLPVLRDASVASIVGMYDFMMRLFRHNLSQLIQKVHLVFYSLYHSNIPAQSWSQCSVMQGTWGSCVTRYGCFHTESYSISTSTGLRVWPWVLLCKCCFLGLPPADSEAVMALLLPLIGPSD